MIDRAHQPGFTLIEVMLALALGLLVTAGLLRVFQNTRAAFRLEAATARLQENARFAAEQIARSIRLAGYTPTPPADFQPISATNGNGIDGSDTLTVRFRSDGQLRNCRGGRMHAGELAENTFLISAAGELSCRTQTTSAQPLAEGVVDLQVQLGVDDNGDGFLDRYLKPNAVDHWEAVRSVRVTLVVRSDDDDLTAAPIRYEVEGQTQQAPDRRLYRVVTRTVALRNRRLN